MGDADTDSIEAWLASRPSEGARCGRLRCGTCVGEWHVEAYLGAGLDALKLEISRRIAAMRHRAELLIPYDKGNVLSLIHGKGQVLQEEYTDAGTRATCLLDAALYQRVLGML